MLDSEWLTIVAWILLFLSANYVIVWICRWVYDLKRGGQPEQSQEEKRRRIARSAPWGILFGAVSGFCIGVIIGDTLATVVIPAVLASVFGVICAVRAPSFSPKKMSPVWTDGYFYAVLGTISSFYVVLIVLLLLFDTVFVATSDMSKDVMLDFAYFHVDGKEKPLKAGATVGDAFDHFGLTISTGDGGQVPLVLDSGRPGNDRRDLGTPHEDFGGPGVGIGGEMKRRQRNPHANSSALGNVLVLSDDGVRPANQGGQFVFHWVDPVAVKEVHLLDVDQPGGAIVTFDKNDKLIRRWPIPNAGPNASQMVKLGRYGVKDVARLEIILPTSGAVTEVRFTWAGHIRKPWERESPVLAKLVYNPITEALGKEEIRYSIKLSLISCTITAILSLWVAVPIGYLLSRHRFWGRNFVDAILDIPIVLPPLVVGISLLILFQFLPQSWREAIVYEIPAVILAQFMVACAFAVRTMRSTFDQIDPRREQVALTLGCSRFQAFGMVVLPEARRGMLTAGTLAWARSLGEFGPLLVFAGATRNKTEVLSTSVYLELSVGDLGAAVAVSLIMVLGAVIVLMIARLWGTRSLTI